MTKIYQKPVTLYCKNCQEPFKAKVSYIRFQKEKKGIEVGFCSRKCFGEFNKKPLSKDIVTMYQNDLSCGDIAKILGVSSAHVKNELYRYGVTLKHPGYYVKKGIKNPTLNKGHSDKTKELMSQQKIALYKGTHTKQLLREKTLEQISSGHMPKANTSIELIMSQILIELGHSFDYQFKFGYWVYDFFLPDHNLFIECDGDYWHGNPAYFQELNDTQKNNIYRGKQKERYAINKGYHLIRVWENELKNSPDSVKELIKSIT